MLGIGAFSIALLTTFADRMLLITLYSSAAACTVATSLGGRGRNGTRMHHILAAVPSPAMLDSAVTRRVALFTE